MTSGHDERGMRTLRSEARRVGMMIDERGMRSEARGIRMNRRHKVRGNRSGEEERGTRSGHDARQHERRGGAGMTSEATRASIKSGNSPDAGATTAANDEAVFAMIIGNQWQRNPWQSV